MPSWLFPRFIWTFQLENAPFYSTNKNIIEWKIYAPLIARQFFSVFFCLFKYGWPNWILCAIKCWTTKTTTSIDSNTPRISNESMWCDVMTELCGSLKWSNDYLWMMQLIVVGMNADYAVDIYANLYASILNVIT